MLIGAGIGLRQEPSASGEVPCGIIANPTDGFSYAAWAQQAKGGAWRFSNPYTTEAHDALLLNPYFLMVGRAARQFDVPVFAVMTVLGAAMAGVTLVAVYGSALRIGFSRRSAGWAMILAAFASGVSAPILAVKDQLGIRFLGGADLFFQDAILFSTFFSYPYHTFGIALLSLTVLLVLVIEDRNTGCRLRRGCFALLGCLALFLVLVRPYEPLMLLATYVLYFVLCLGRVERQTLRRRAAVVGLLAVAILPPLSYHGWVAKQPVWDHFAFASLSLQRDRWFWLIGYGAVLPLSLIGAWSSFRRNERSPACWLAVWVVLVTVLLTVICVPQSKVCAGGHLPMCILAGAAWNDLLDRLRRTRHRLVRVGSYAAAAGVALLLFVTSGHLLGSYRSYGYDADLKRVAATIRRLSENPVPAVLCDAQTGEVLPGVAGLRVICGHWALTPNYVKWRAELARCGVERAASSLPIPEGSAALSALLRRTGVEFALLPKGVKAADYLAEIDGTVLIESCGRWLLFRIELADVPALPATPPPPPTRDTPTRPGRRRSAEALLRLRPAGPDRPVG